MKNTLTILLSTSLIACNSGGNQDKSNLNNNPSLKILTNDIDFPTFQKIHQGSDIDKLSNATVGLIIPKIKDNEIQKSLCTGVIISSNEILTAAHCLKESGDIYKRDSKITIYQYKDNNNYGEAILSQAADDLKYNQAEYLYQFGSDLAIIKFKEANFKHIVPKEKILTLNNKYSENIDSTQDKLKKSLGTVFTESSHVYRFGWGSNRKFQTHTLPLFSNNQTCNIAFKQMEKIDENISQIYNTDKYIFKGNNTTKGLKTITADDVYSNTNILDYVETPAISEQGDSGGPIFICTKVNNDCYLSAIIHGERKADSGPNKGQMSGIQTTLVNPYFDQIFNNK